MARFLHELLPIPDARAASSLDGFLAEVRSLSATRTPFELACAGGVRADRVGFAFAAGYQAALLALVPGLDRARTYALCATESGGVHPAAIRTALTDDAGARRLDGEKAFVTLGDRADVLFVAARTGETRDGKERLALARVGARARGVSIAPLPELPFCPEVGHARLALEGVRVAPEDVLAGDGYDRYVKPFRTIEDVHVHAALVAYVLGVAAREGWPLDTREGLVAVLASLGALAEADPSAPATHVALAGTMALSRRLLAELEPRWSEGAPDVRERWERDRALFSVAERARTKRLERAWAALGGLAARPAR